MPHHPAFVITSIPLARNRVPSDTELREAAAQAQQMATALAQAMPDDDSDSPRPESLAIGCNTYRFVQGNEDSNYDTFAGMPRDQWPNTTFEFWSDRSGTMANAADASADILGWSWNSTSKLVTLGLESNPRRRQIYPSLLLSPEEPQLLHHLCYQDYDVFGDDQPHCAAQNYIEGDPVLSWHRAKSPLEELAKAAFRVDYLKALHRQPDRLVMELDWNL